MAKWNVSIFNPERRFDEILDKLRRAYVLAERDADEIARLRDEIDRLREAFEWSPIETAPKDGTSVLVFGPLKDGSGHYHEVCRYWKDRWPVEWMANCLAPTHWMALPPAPRAALGSAS